VAGLLLFSLASAAGGLAPNAGSLIAARAVQGAGGAIIMPLTLTLLGAAFSGEQRAKALGTWSAISGAGVALGPIVGGVLTELLSWHWIFWVNVPVGLVAAAFAPRVLEESRGRSQRVDLIGLALASTGLLAVVWATARANANGWTAPVTLVGLLVGVALLVTFVSWEAHTDAPMVPLRFFRAPSFTTANTANFLLGFAMFAGFVMIIQYLTSVRGEGPVSSGLHALFWTAVPMIVSPTAARLGRRTAPSAMIAAGLALVSAGLLLVVALTPADASAFAMAPGLLMIGTGIGLVIPNAASAGIASVAADEIGKASGVVSTSRQVGSVFGVSVALALFQSVSAGGGAVAITSGVHAGLIAGAAAAAVGAVIAVAERLHLSHRLMLARSEA
jgi:EmrB/QacA subfamily drug resistance transporter